LSPLAPEPATPKPPPVAGGDDKELRKWFDAFVGETFYGQMLQAMRKTVGEAAYFNGGRAEEIFQGQLDQLLAERLTQANAGNFTDSMFKLFTSQRS
jgi:hypothetical protein